MSHNSDKENDDPQLPSEDTLEWFDAEGELGDDFDFASLADSLVQPDKHETQMQPLVEEQVATSLTNLLQSITSSGVVSSELEAVESELAAVSEAESVQVGVRHVLFEAGGYLLGLPLTGVREIDRREKVTVLPRTPRWLRGLCNLRGQIVSVTDLCEVLGLPSRKSTHAEKIIVVRSEKLDVSTALVVDRVLGIRSLQVEPLQPQDADENLIQYAYGMAILSKQQQELQVETSSSVILLLDPDLLLGGDTLSAFGRSTASETVR